MIFDERFLFQFGWSLKEICFIVGGCHLHSHIEFVFINVLYRTAHFMLWEKKIDWRSVKIYTKLLNLPNLGESHIESFSSTPKLPYSWDDLYSSICSKRICIPSRPHIALLSRPECRRKNHLEEKNWKLEFPDLNLFIL